MVSEGGELSCQDLTPFPLSLLSSTSQSTTQGCRMSSEDNEVEEIGAYEARIHLGRLLDAVASGSSYVISKRHRRAAVLVPFEHWFVRKGPGNVDAAEAQELDSLLRQLDERHQATLDSLDEAFAELGRTREQIAALRAEREQATHQAGMEGDHARGR